MLFGALDELRIGDPWDLATDLGPVIDREAQARIEAHCERAEREGRLLRRLGTPGEGWFAAPAVVRVDGIEALAEEIFGPVLTVFFYPDREYAETLDLCRNTSPYGLTGAVFANDRLAAEQAYDALRNAAGNFYINDKPTGAVVGQQPFGGARASGTNDKAGSLLNMIRWVSPRTTKENFLPPRDYRYPHMQEDAS